jgi:hypothetical protein
MTESVATIDAEAEAAASEAAREARDEVYERVAAAPKGKRKKVARPKPANGWHTFLVDVWITDFNTIEFGLYKNSRNRAKSRQFTSDMDIFAEVVEGDGERTGLLGYREDLWKDKTGMGKRLVCKLFSETVNWRATMDLMLGRSLQQTIGARGFPVISYAINTNDDDNSIIIDRSANKWPLLPENFSFFLIGEKDRPAFFRFRRTLLNLGGDYLLLDEKDEVVGWLDGKVLSLAGKWYGGVRWDHVHRTKLAMVMQLFVGAIIFNRGCRRHLKALWHDVREGRLAPKLERQEADLYLNPRRLR